MSTAVSRRYINIYIYIYIVNCSGQGRPVRVKHDE